MRKILTFIFLCVRFAVLAVLCASSRMKMLTKNCFGIPMLCLIGMLLSGAVVVAYAEEKTSKELAGEEITELLKQVSDAKPTVRQEAFRQLSAGGAKAKEETVKYLKEQREILLKKIKSNAPSKSSRWTEKGNPALQSAREKALKLIRDQKLYYKKDDGKVVCQEDVDKLVNEVRQLWTKMVKSQCLSRTCLDSLERLKEYDEYLKRMGQMPEEGYDPLTQGLLKVLEGEVSACNPSLSGADSPLIKEKKIKVSDKETEATKYTNEYRLMMGLKPLAINEALIKAAQGHSKDMADRDYFAHNSPDGSTPESRMKDAGYPKMCLGGENIARGQLTGKDVVADWLISPAHHRNIVRDDYSEIGLGEHKDYWTQNFGHVVTKPKK